MRISLVILFCLFTVVVNSATTRHTTKASARKSVYDYLRSVRGKNSCASGSCPFWEKHGRSFVSLRCYAQEYQDCVCLHKMCYKSCLFSREVCNQEMVSCLQQICPRCLPASQLAVCAISNSMTASVTNALSTFSCYSCCPIRAGLNNKNITKPVKAITPPTGNRVPRPGNGLVAGSVRPSNVPQNGNRPAGGNAGSVNNGNRPASGNAGSVNNGNRPAGGNAGSVNGANRPSNGGNNGLKKPSNGNQGSINNNKGANLNQRVQKKASTTRRPVNAKPQSVRTTKRA